MPSAYEDKDGRVEVFLPSRLPEVEGGQTEHALAERSAVFEFIPIKQQVPTEPVNPVLRRKCRKLLFPMGSKAWRA
jgi:hypothetical protein